MAGARIEPRIPWTEAQVNWQPHGSRLPDCQTRPGLLRRNVIAVPEPVANVRVVFNRELQTSNGRTLHPRGRFHGKLRITTPHYRARTASCRDMSRAAIAHTHTRST